MDLQTSPLPLRSGHKKSPTNFHDYIPILTCLHFTSIAHISLWSRHLHCLHQPSTNPPWSYMHNYCISTPFALHTSTFTVEVSVGSAKGLFIGIYNSWTNMSMGLCCGFTISHTHICPWIPLHQKFKFLQKWPNCQGRLELIWRSFSA